MQSETQNQAGSSAAAPEESKPWWRYPMVWMIIAGPAIVVVAAIYTAILAHQGADMLVKPDDMKEIAHMRELNAYSDMTDPNTADPSLLPADKVRKLGQDAHKTLAATPQP